MQRLPGSLCCDRERYGEKIKLVVLKEGSKVKALNAGDKVATCFPRFYLDADIRISLDDMAKINSYMSEHRLMAASTMLDYDYKTKLASTLVLQDLDSVTLRLINGEYRFGTLYS